ncbi:MAG TPA: trypsin-like peptidase domain-containing protein [Pyrinomonadaceae bacterium]|jgi:S1-C subfamily serine protease
MENINKKSSRCGVIIRTTVIMLLTVFFITLIIGGFFSVNRNLPLATSASVIFSENALQGISEPNTVSDEQNNIEVYRAVSPGVVLISTGSEQGDFYSERNEETRAGSGVVVDTKGHILTNEHVVRSARTLSVNLGGDRVFPAKLIGSDPDTDLAVIKIDAPVEQLTVIPVGDSDALTVGQKVLAIGNPFGLDRTLTTGVISGLQRPIRARNGRPIEGAIQTDASINPGNSGGPLLDKYGRMIGVNSQILSPSGTSNGIGFAIPVSIVKRVVPQLIQSGKVNRPRLGVGTKSVAELRQQGVGFPLENGLLVITIAPGSAAERAGLRPTTQNYDGRINMGDIITALDGRALKSVDELYRAIDGRQIGDSIQLEVWRDGRQKTLEVKLETESNTKIEASGNSQKPSMKQPRKQPGF